jgi:DNA adenine methylase
MKYMGSKARIARHILPIMLNNRVEGQWWVEPFVGGGNIIDKVEGNRLGADSNSSVVEALCFIRDGDIPKNDQEFTEDDYNLAAGLARHNLLQGCSDGVRHYALIAFSFGAKWIGGWSRGKDSKGNPRDYVAEQYRANIKQKPLLHGVHLKCSSYLELTIPKSSIIYCDIPYFGTTKYKDAFDHDRFWSWCRVKAKSGHTIFISEYNAPADFVCVWQQELKVSVAKEGKQKTAVEKLFVHKSQVESDYESIY